MDTNRKLARIENLGDEILITTQGRDEWFTVGEIARIVAAARYYAGLGWWRAFWHRFLGDWAITPSHRAVYSELTDMTGFFEQRKRQDPSIKGGWDVEYHRIPWEEDTARVGAASVLRSRYLGLD